MPGFIISHMLTVKISLQYKSYLNEFKSPDFKNNDLKIYDFFKFLNDHLSQKSVIHHLFHKLL